MLGQQDVFLQHNARASLRHIREETRQQRRLAVDEDLCVVMKELVSAFFAARNASGNYRRQPLQKFPGANVAATEAKSKVRDLKGR